MPKSKRAKVVHLSKTQKKGKALSRKHFDDLQAAAQKYQYVFVFEVDNMRNNHFKEVRKEFWDSRSVNTSSNRLGALSRHLHSPLQSLFFKISKSRRDNITTLTTPDTKDK